MKIEKPRKRKGLATHYSYLGGGESFVRVVKLFNLAGITITRRRELIHQLIDRDGELLATLPANFRVDCDLDVLEQYLKTGLK